MLNNSSKIMFSFILMTDTLITISSNNWLSAWMGLEINLLSFIPLMKDNNLMSTEATLKYFLTQAMASATLLFAVIMNYMNNMNIYLEDTPLYFSLIMMSSLLLKMGAAPFHFWFPNVMEGLSWMNGLILMTWQKIAPLMLLSYIINNTLLMFIIMSVIVGSLGGLNQTSLRKLMAFSSINHLGWMLSAMQVNEMNWLMYFMFYSFLSASIIMLFNNYKLYHINQLFNSFFTSKTIKFTFFLNLISLGGLPPFIGFMPKWLVIQSLVLTNQYFLLTILMLTALVTLFFYIRLCFAAFMLNYYENNWILNSQISNKSTNLMLSMSFISTFGLILISLIYTIL